MLHIVTHVKIRVPILLPKITLSNPKWYSRSMPHPPKNPLKPLDLGPESVGDRLQKIRKQKGFTQAEVATIVGTTRESIAAYESGRVRLSDDMLARFSIALATSADQILGLSGQPTEEPPAMKIMRRVRQIEQLPLAKQKVLLQTIDGYLKGEGI